MTPSLDHFPFARPHLSGVCAKAARLHPSSQGRAATFNHSERQRSSGTALGLRWGMYRTTCAVGTTGRHFAGLGCLLPYSAGGFGFRPFSALSHIDGIGRRANAILANLIHNAVEDERVAIRPRELRQIEEYTGLRYGRQELSELDALSDLVAVRNGTMTVDAARANAEIAKQLFNGVRLVVNAQKYLEQRALPVRPAHPNDDGNSD